MASGMDNPREIVQFLRDASRRLVREWGFMGPTIADSILSAAAVHCLIEIGDRGINTFGSLREVLLVPDSQLTQVLAELIASGDIYVEQTTQNTRYTLTPAGTATLAAINAYAHEAGRQSSRDDFPGRTEQTS